MEQSARRIVATPLFRHTVTLLVVASAALVGVEAYETAAGRHNPLILTLDVLITLAFIVEIGIRITTEWSNPRRFFSRPWNTFDFLLVVAALVPLTAGFAGVLRMVRLLRILRIVGRLPRLRVLLTTTVLSIPSLFSIGVLLGVLFYTYATAGVFLFSANDPIHFGDPHTSFMSLFRVITLEDWTDIMYTQVYGCENYGYDNMAELCTDSQEFGAWGALFFMSFVFVGSFIALNLFVGIIIIGMDEARAQVRRDDLLVGRRTNTRPGEYDSDLERLHERLENVQLMLAELLQDAEESDIDLSGRGRSSADIELSGRGRSSADIELSGRGRSSPDPPGGTPPPGSGPGGDPGLPVGAGRSLTSFGERMSFPSGPLP